jgi:hypothetical protein
MRKPLLRSGLMILMVASARGQVNYADAAAFDYHDVLMSPSIPLAEPALSYWKFFEHVKDFGTKPISDEARAAVRLNDKELRSLLTITSDLAKKSSDFAQTFRPLVFELRIEAAGGDDPAPALVEKMRSLRDLWSATVLDHFTQLKDAVPEPVFRDLDEFVRSGKPLFSIPPDTPKTKF